MAKDSAHFIFCCKITSHIIFINFLLFYYIGGSFSWLLLSPSQSLIVFWTWTTSDLWMNTCYFPHLRDHYLIIFNTRCTKSPILIIIKTDWRNYQKEFLNTHRMEADREFGYETVQFCCHSFESRLVTVVDNLAPFDYFQNHSATRNNPLRAIRNKINI